MNKILTSAQLALKLFLYCQMITSYRLFYRRICQTTNNKQKNVLFAYTLFTYFSHQHTNTYIKINKQPRTPSSEHHNALPSNRLHTTSFNLPRRNKSYLHIDNKVEWVFLPLNQPKQHLIMWKFTWHYILFILFC